MAHFSVAPNPVKLVESAGEIRLRPWARSLSVLKKVPAIKRFKVQERNANPQPRTPVLEPSMRNLIFQSRAIPWATQTAQPAWCSRAAIDLRQSRSGTLPKIPKQQSTRRHERGMPRKCPAIRARGMTPAHPIRPNVITHLFLTGSMNGPMNAVAMTRWANASQSVPYARNGN